VQARTCPRRQGATLLELGIASTDTLGLPVADVPETMGFWRKTGISDE
jgi:hypothetical protein